LLQVRAIDQERLDFPEEAIVQLFEGVLRGEGRSDAAGDDGQGSEAWRVSRSARGTRDRKGKRADADGKETDGAGCERNALRRSPRRNVVNLQRLRMQ
jgi:hypothetical protein